MAILNRLHDYNFLLASVVDNIEMFLFVFINISVMFERLAENGREFEKKTKQHMNEYADAG